MMRTASGVGPIDRESGRACEASRASRRSRRARLGLAALSFGLGVPLRAARADIPASNVDFMMYGRMGIGWTPSGQVIAGKYMNLGTRRAIGGRLEEGDYLQPGLRYHLKKGHGAADTTVDVVMDVEMFSKYGSIVSDLANGDIKDISIMPLQAYVEAKNVVTEGLTVWMGSRLYRKNDIHICDYFYFNNLPGQGVGVEHGGLDAAVLTQTGANPFFDAVVQQDAQRPAAEAPTVKRQRTILVAMYKVPIGPRGTYVQALGEVHLVPESRSGVATAPPGVNPADYGWVMGLKAHLDLGAFNFADTSVRYGTRIANGAESGGSTYHTFGAPGLDGTYDGAHGLEVVEHFLWKVGSVVAINGYFTAHYSKGARDDGVPTSPPEGPPPSAAPAKPDSRLDYALGARTTFFLTDELHLLAEATYQARKDGELPTGTLVKLSVAPTLVPTGERSAWARPEMRFIYSTGLYNQAAVDQLMSPYLQTVGPQRVAHFIGARSEWWF